MMTDAQRIAHMIGLRNLLTHEYFRVKPELLYDTAVGDMPGLKVKLESLGL